MDITQQWRKAAGLFVEMPRTEALRAEESEAETDDPQELVEACPVGEFTAIYAEAGLPAVAFSAEQMRAMLGSLPAELPLPIRRQTLTVTLDALGKTVGATSDTIKADASRKMAALADYAGRLTEQTAKSAADAEAEIAALQAQIEERREAIAAGQARLEETVQQCRTEADHLGEVLTFFSPTGHIE